MTYEIETRVLPKQPTAVVEATLSVPEISGWLPGVYQEVAAYLGRAHVPMAGPPFAKYAFHDSLVDVEAGFPVTEPIQGEGRVVPSSLSAGPAAVATHYGPYEQLGLAYDAVEVWLREHGLEPNGPHWEVYYTDPQEQPDPARWRTDVIAPFRVS